MRRPKRSASRSPTARSTRSHVSKDDALMPSLLTLSDVMGTGHHAAVIARVRRGTGRGRRRRRGRPLRRHRREASRRRADHHLGRHPDRIALAQSFGATDVVSERGEEASSGSASSPAGSAPTRFSSASARLRQWPLRSRIARPAARRPGRCAALRGDPGAGARRSTRTSPSAAVRLRYAPTSRAAARRPGGGSTRPGLRPHGRPRRRARRLSGDERARVDQGNGEALTNPLNAPRSSRVAGLCILLLVASGLGNAGPDARGVSSSTRQA